MIFQFTKLVFSTTQLTTALNFLCLFTYNNNLSYVIIALWVLYLSITPTDQSIDFPSSSPLVTGGGSTDGVSSPSLIFSKCIRNYYFVNTFLKFHFHHSMNYLLRSLFNYFTTHSKNVNPKNKKPSLFSVTVDIVSKLTKFESIQYHRQHIHNL